MFRRRRSSLYLQLNTPLSRKESTNNAPVMSGGLSDVFGEQPRRHRHATMLELIHEKRTEFQLFGSERNMSAIQDLNNLLYTRERLQELGCTFTTEGELSTFGDPTRLQQFEQLLRLGPMYDEQWTGLFNKGQTPASEDEAAMWSDMRTLKRVLANESVAFAVDHQRLNHGTESAKLFRLCAAYDDLHKLWSASIPARTLMPMPEREQDETIDDSGCYMDENSNGLDEGVDDMPEGGASSGDLNDSKASLPRNIGWRFSDDYTPIAQDRDSMSDDDLAELEAAVAVAVAAQSASRPSPVDENKSRREQTPLPAFVSATFRNSGQSAFKTRLRHGPYPFQSIATAGLEQGVELKPESHGRNTNSLGSVGSMNSTTNSTTSLQKSVDGKGDGKKGRKGWWREMFGRAYDPTGTEKYNLVGGWW